MRRFYATDACRGRCHVPLENRDSLTGEVFILAVLCHIGL